MSEDRLKILEMIQNGIVSAADGAELLKALDVNKDEVKEIKKAPFKMFKVKIISGDGDKVNVQIPIEFAKVALKSGNGMMKLNNLEQYDIDVNQLFEMIDSGAIGKIVDIEAADGSIVEVIVE